MKDGDDLRINAQLIDVKPDKILWRESFDLKYDKLLTVQDRVAQQIIKELEDAHNKQIFGDQMMREKRRYLSC